MITCVMMSSNCDVDDGVKGTRITTVRRKIHPTLKYSGIAQWLVCLAQDQIQSSFPPSAVNMSISHSS